MKIYTQVIILGELLNNTILQLKYSAKTYLFIQLLIIKYQIYEFVLKIL